KIFVSGAKPGALHARRASHYCRKTYGKCRRVGDFLRLHTGPKSNLRWIQKSSQHSSLPADHANAPKPCPDEFTAFLTKALRHHAAFSQQGSIHFICMDWRHIGELLRAGEAVYSELKNLCVWKKTNAGMGSFYRSQHELVFVFQNGSGPNINNIQLGTFG